MSPNPVSLLADASIPEAVTLMTDRGFSATPVIDDAGHPVGVLSQTDILIHTREQMDRPRTDAARVRDIMTPALFTVSHDAPATTVVRRMCELRVHRLFVVDDDNALVGVISALDVLRCLETEQ
jgi:CBS domain-containing protein